MHLLRPVRRVALPTDAPQFPRQRLGVVRPPITVRGQSHEHRVRNAARQRADLLQRPDARTGLGRRHRLHTARTTLRLPGAAAESRLGGGEAGDRRARQTRHQTATETERRRMASSGHLPQGKGTFCCHLFLIHYYEILLIETMEICLNMLKQSPKVGTYFSAAYSN